MIPAHIQRKPQAITKKATQNPPLLLLLLKHHRPERALRTTHTQTPTHLALEDRDLFVRLPPFVGRRLKIAPESFRHGLARTGAGTNTASANTAWANTARVSARPATPRRPGRVPPLARPPRRLAAGARRRLACAEAGLPSYVS